jgi:hypothetical protein
MCAWELAPVHDEACVIVSIEGLAIVPLDGPDEREALGDRGAVTADQVDFRVV